MQYFGKKSISSLMCVLLRILWFVLAVFFSGIILGYGLLLAFPDLANQIPEECSQDFQQELEDSLTGTEITQWNRFMDQPLFLRWLVVPYGIVIVVLLLGLISKIRKLFVHFSRNIVFSNENTQVIKEISKLSLVFSIMTLNLSLVLITIILYFLCRIFEKGSFLQEDQDLTI